MTAGIGHNRKTRPGGVAVDQMNAIIERVEKIREEKAALSADESDVWAEAKGNGFDVKALKQIIKIRSQDASEREEQENILHTYMHALGMLPELEDGSEDLDEHDDPAD